MSCAVVAHQIFFHVSENASFEYLQAVVHFWLIRDVHGMKSKKSSMMENESSLSCFFKDDEGGGGIHCVEGFLTLGLESIQTLILLHPTNHFSGSTHFAFKFLTFKEL